VCVFTQKREKIKHLARLTLIVAEIDASYTPVFVSAKLTTQYS